MKKVGPKGLSKLLHNRVKFHFSCFHNHFCMVLFIILWRDSKIKEKMKNILFKKRNKINRSVWLYLYFIKNSEKTTEKQQLIFQRTKIFFIFCVKLFLLYI